MSDTLLNDIPQAICTAITARLPELRECEPYFGKFDATELKKRGTNTPAVLVSILKADQVPSSGFVKNYMLDVAAFIITANHSSEGNPGYHAANIAQVILYLVPENRWGVTGIGAARKVQMHPMITSKARDLGVAIWAVQWDQPMTLRTAEDAPLGVDLYVSSPPEIGADNLAAYDEIGGGQ